MFSSKQKPVRLEKQLTLDEKLALKKQEVRIWTMKHCFGLIMITTIVSLITFIIICFMFIHGTDSGAYYNWGMR